MVLVVGIFEDYSLESSTDLVVFCEEGFLRRTSGIVVEIEFKCVWREILGCTGYLGVFLIDLT